MVYILRLEHHTREETLLDLIFSICALWGRMTNKTIGLTLTTPLIKARFLQQRRRFTLISHSPFRFCNVGPNGVRRT